jgi:hypothetical protein
VCRPTESGCIVVRESSEDQGLEHGDLGLKEDVQLRFYIQTDNPYFRIFTDMSHSGDGPQAFHFTNASAANAVTDVFYHGRKSAGREDLKLINRKAFTYTVSNPDAKRVTVFDRELNLVAERELEDASDFFIDLWDYPEGQYTISEDYEHVQTIVTTSTDPEEFVGFIDVVLTPDRFESALDGSDPINFDVHFKAREVYWKYIVVSDEAKFGQYEIQTGTALKFKEEPIEKGSLRKRNTYITSRKIKLKERYKFKLNLRDVASGTVLIKDLAHPKAESVQPMQPEGEDHCLEIYLVI